MKKFFIGVFVVFLLIILFICGVYLINRYNYKHSNRNFIEFNAPIKDIESRMRYINAIFDKIRQEHNDSIWINYFWDNNNNFRICDTIIGKLNFENIDKFCLTKNFSKEEKEKFIDNINFLNSNFLSGMHLYLHRPFNVYYYNYRFLENDWDIDRMIVCYNEKVDTTFLFNFNVLLDKKGSLLLFRHKYTNEK
ncbi:MAG: hypothetical protein LBL74_06210 [Bacteroidales bacterium]|jgi:hypothetical protein|nr:hypothetical protein [Bacteroidales bacterium]